MRKIKENENAPFIRNRLILILLFALSLAAISIRGGAVSYTFFALCLIVPALSGIYLLYVYLSFHIYQEVDSRTIVKGEEVPYRFSLTNEYFLVYTDVSVSFYRDFSDLTDMPEEERVTLFPKDSIRYEAALSGKYSGEYPVGIKDVTIVDYLHLFRVRYALSSPLTVKVLPRIANVSGDGLLSELQRRAESSDVKRKEEPDSVVRDYRPGDPMKKVHWKASAKSGKLQVRTETGFTELTPLLFFDRTPSEAESETDRMTAKDTRLEIAVALAKFFTDRHVPLAVCLSGKDGIMHAFSEEDFPSVYDAFCDVYFEKTEENLPADFENDAFVIWVTGDVTKEWMLKVLQTSSAGANLMILSVSDKRECALSYPDHPNLFLYQIEPGTPAESVFA